MNKILLKYILKYSESMVPYFNKDGKLVGVGIKGVSGGKMFALKYFDDKAMEWLLEKFKKVSQFLSSLNQTVISNN